MATQPLPQSVKPSLATMLEKYVRVTKSTNTSSLLPYEGICQRPTCGWHTMQLRERDAYTLLRQHVLSHWRDVVNQL